MNAGFKCLCGSPKEMKEEGFDFSETLDGELIQFKAKRFRCLDCGLHYADGKEMSVMYSKARRQLADSKVK